MESKKVELIEAESSMVVTRSWREAGNGEILSKGCKVSDMQAE